MLEVLVYLGLSCILTACIVKQPFLWIFYFELYDEKQGFSKLNLLTDTRKLKSYNYLISPNSFMHEEQCWHLSSFGLEHLETLIFILTLVAFCQYWGIPDFHEPDIFLTDGRTFLISKLWMTVVFVCVINYATA